MNVWKQTAMAGAVALTAGLTPAGVVHGQSSRESIVGAVQIGGGSRIGVSVADF